jgi:hypothetical protein
MRKPPTGEPCAGERHPFLGNDAESSRRPDHRGHNRSVWGGRLRERKPVGLDARIDLRGHHHRSLDDQPGVPGY